MQLAASGTLTPIPTRSLSSLTISRYVGWKRAMLCDEQPARPNEYELFAALGFVGSEIPSSVTVSPTPTPTLAPTPKREVRVAILRAALAKLLREQAEDESRDAAAAAAAKAAAEANRPSLIGVLLEMKKPVPPAQPALGAWSSSQKAASNNAKVRAWQDNELSQKAAKRLASIPRLQLVDSVSVKAASGSTGSGIFSRMVLNPPLLRAKQGTLLSNGKWPERSQRRLDGCKWVPWRKRMVCDEDSQGIVSIFLKTKPKKKQRSVFIIYIFLYFAVIN